MTCDKRLDVPEGMRAAALDFPSNLPVGAGGVLLPDEVRCELDKHPYGEHVALMRDLGEGACVWITWNGDGGADFKVQRRDTCTSSSPSSGEELPCWLPAAHRGGHSWERYE